MRTYILTLLLAYMALNLPTSAEADSVQSIRTLTRSCLLCGMNVGEVSIKVCGNIGCCVSLRLKNDDNNFQSGEVDVFEGAATLAECDNFQIGDKDLGQVQISLTHEGSDGLELEYVDVVTDERSVRCPIGTDIDGDDWIQVLCR